MEIENFKWNLIDGNLGKNDVQEFLLHAEVKENHKECLQILDNDTSTNQVKNQYQLSDFFK